MADAGRSEEPDMKKQFTVHCSKFTVKNEQGFVLVVALLALLVITAIGVLALSTSTTEVMVAGNARLREINFSSADSGLEIASPALRSLLGSLYISSAYAPIVSDLNLVSELRSGPSFDGDLPSSTPDLTLAGFGGSSLFATKTVNVDIDRMFSGPCGGTALEFASGYEGIGAGGGGGTCAYYRVNSMSSWEVGSENVVGGVYRYVVY